MKQILLITKLNKIFFVKTRLNTIGIGGVGVDLALYETLKTKYKALYPENPQPSAFTLLLFANTSSSIAMYTTYPLFMIRTRMQSSSNPKETVGSIALRVFKQDGIRGFYRGAFANLTKVAPSASIGYFMYEQTNKLLGIQ